MLARSPVALGCLLVACASSPPAPSAKSAGAPAAKEGPAEHCLAEATAPRTPKKDAPEKITVSHILVRHKDLKRSEEATRTRAEACLRAQAARDKLLAGAEWDEVAKEFSDAGDATGGKLGSVSKSELDETFANAAFALGPGELSHVVETPRGFHVIARTE